MSFTAPQFFLIIPFLAVIGWYFRRLEFWRPLRVATLLAFVVTLANPQCTQIKDGMDLWVLVDRSASAAEMVDANVDEWKRLLENSRPSRRNDKVRFVDYATEVITTQNSETVVYPGGKQLTRTALALQDVAALADPEKHTRILIFSDGYSTEPLTGVGEKLQNSNIPLDFRLLRSPRENDFRISSLEVPERVQLGEPFIIDLSVEGTGDGEIPATIMRGGEPLVETSITVTQGVGTARFTDRIGEPGSFHYEVLIRPEDDAFSGNNRYESFIEVVAGPRVLLISKYLDDPVEKMLQGQGFTVEVVSDPLSLNVGQLTGIKNVIINNVPAYELPNDFIDALPFFVSEQGGGLLMAGGKFSFGSGGYYQSAVDPLLPITMELKSEHRKLAVAMAIVMDRSGSMGAVVSSGHTKMDLANEGSARAVELLGGQDLITVYAVDSAAHQMVPLLNVRQHKDEIVNRVRRIQSMGGGIYVYTGLKEAWDQLKEAEFGQRHIILFSDAADSEEPGRYKQLIKEMTENSGSVSVIGLGTKSDSDAAFLEDIAKRGNGRMFFTENAGAIPNIFAQETVTVARSTFIDEPVNTQPTGSWYEISNKDFEWLSAVDGYNLSYIREGDTAAILSTDEYAAPLVSWGRRGIGRTAAVSFPLGGEFSQKVRNWEKAGDFVQTLNRWLMGDQIPAGIGLRHKVEGTQLTVDLLYDEEEWRDRFSAVPPRILLSIGDTGGGQMKELTWERLAPGHFTVHTDLPEGQPTRGAIQIGKQALRFGPVVVGTSTEWAFDQDRVDELVSASQASGGRELVDLSDAWRKPERQAKSGILPWMFTGLLVLVLAEALVTRTGWRLPEFSLIRQGNARKKSRKVKVPKVVTKPANVSSVVPEKPSKPVPSPQPEAESKETRRSRFDRAKKKR